MKIFLNERTVEFVASRPENPAADTRVVEYQPAVTLETSWEEFKRYEKFRHLVIIDPEFSSLETSAAFQAFASLFRFIPAAGGLVRNEQGEFLFIHRLGFWDLPKGKINKRDIPGKEHADQDGASARAAAIREVLEETGLQTVVIRKELPSTWHIYKAKERWVLKETKWFEMEADSGQKLKPQASEGIFLVKWTPLNAIHCILSHAYASIRELLLEVLF
jgi:8-oxo-dGTP pyrophosphatase MutT (NUDIX family)